MNVLCRLLGQDYEVFHTYRKPWLIRVRLGHVYASLDGWPGWKNTWEYVSFIEKS